ncbi:hypothetical protein [Paenibacillus sp. NPDC058071]|uniref:hypothetical protein n=1 Tax=Paenibacillus sp. NPDC058071 TaxID=3346326 RepID=UPI0036DA4B33
MKTYLIGSIAAIVIVGGVIAGGSYYYNTKESHKDNQITTEVTPPVASAPSPTPSVTPVVEVEPEPIEQPTSESTFILDHIVNDESIREQLYRMYGRFNGLVGTYDNYKKTSAEEWKELLGYTFLSPDVYKQFSHVTSSELLKKDFLNVADLVAFANKGLEDGIPSKDDIKALLYAYEIVNDVQAWSLPQQGDNLKVRKKFGASYALENHDQAAIIEEWLRDLDTL